MNRPGLSIMRQRHPVILWGLILFIAMFFLTGPMLLITLRFTPPSTSAVFLAVRIAVTIKVFSLVMSILLLHRYSKATQELDEDTTWCRGCGYDLVDLKSCPECGERRSLPAARIRIFRAANHRARLYSTFPEARREQRRATLYVAIGLTGLVAAMLILTAESISVSKLAAIPLFLASLPMICMVSKHNTRTHDRYAQIDVDRSWCRRCNADRPIGDEPCPACRAAADAQPPLDVKALLIVNLIVLISAAVVIILTLF